MKECRDCVNYDPSDGYCVMFAAYVHEWETCEEFRQPRKWLYLISKMEGEHDGKDMDGWKAEGKGYDGHGTAVMD